MELDRTALPDMNTLIDALKNTYDEVQGIIINHNFIDPCTIWLARILVFLLVLIQLVIFDSGNLTSSPWKLHL